MSVLIGKTTSFLDCVTFAVRSRQLLVRALLRIQGRFALGIDTKLEGSLFRNSLTRLLRFAPHKSADPAEEISC